MSHTAQDRRSNTGRTDRHTLFIGRQPILDTRQQLQGYELLFRSGFDNRYNHTDGDQATRLSVNTALNLLGLNQTSGGKLVFVNLTRDLLVQRFFTILPKRHTVVELLEDIVVDDEVLAACRELKAAGYMMALDDFALNPDSRQLVPMADVIKVDFMATDVASRRAIMEELRRPGLAFLAEKVETHEEFESARRMGYHYFQGYFFAKPQVIAARDIPATKQTAVMLLQQVSQTPMDFDALERTIRQEISFSVKLLRYLNSSMMDLREKVQSIRQALTLLGERELRQWGSVVAMTCLGEDKPDELLRLCLVRGGFCERLAPHLDGLPDEVDLFLLGLLSSLDALLDQPMSDVLPHLPLVSEIKMALLGQSPKLGKVPLIMLACERGDFGRAATLGKMMGIEDTAIAAAYTEAMAWADNVMKLATETESPNAN